MALYWVHSSYMLKKMFKGIGSKPSPPHKLHQVASQVVPGGTTLAFVALFGLPPHALNVVSACTRYWIHKVLRVVDCEVLIAMLVDAIVGSPQVRNDGCSWQYISLQDGDQCGCIPSINSHEKAVVVGRISAAEDPLCVHHPTYVILPAYECSLVYLHSVAWSPNLHRMRQKMLPVDVPAVLTPVIACIMADVVLSLEIFVACLFKCICICDAHDLLQRQPGASKKTALTNG